MKATVPILFSIVSRVEYTRYETTKVRGRGIVCTNATVLQTTIVWIGMSRHRKSNDLSAHTYACKENGAAALVGGKQVGN